MNLNLINSLDMDTKLSDIVCPLAQAQVHALGNGLMAYLHEQEKQGNEFMLIGGEFFTNINGLPYRMASNTNGWVMAELKYLRGAYWLLEGQYAMPSLAHLATTHLS